jgi:PadR family transcriptional regulator PadR
MRRYAKSMLDIERRVLRLIGEHAESQPLGVYGYELAALLSQSATARQGAEIVPRHMRANGTVYKILYRLGRIGAVSSHWEEAEVALAEGRPRRRYWVLTENGQARSSNLRRNHARRLRQGLPETDLRTSG